MYPIFKGIVNMSFKSLKAHSKLWNMGQGGSMEKWLTIEPI